MSEREHRVERRSFGVSSGDAYHPDVAPRMLAARSPMDDLAERDRREEVAFELVRGSCLARTRKSRRAAARASACAAGHGHRAPTSDPPADVAEPPDGRRSGGALAVRPSSGGNGASVPAHIWLAGQSTSSMQRLRRRCRARTPCARRARRDRYSYITRVVAASTAAGRLARGAHRRRAVVRAREVWMSACVIIPPPGAPEVGARRRPCFLVNHRRRFSTSLIASFTFQPAVRNVLIAVA